MVIYSWNMLYRNTELDKAFEFIAGARDADIFCLQEVPDEFLVRLHKLPYHIVSHVESDRVFSEGNVRLNSVILTRHPVTGQGEIPFEDSLKQPLLRSRLFGKIAWRRHYTPIINRGALWADITVGSTSVRIFNIHLMLSHPLWRYKEFERVMVVHDRTKAAIVCGDFNTLEKPHITPLNWFMGGRLSDALLYRRERKYMEKRFVEYRFKNPLRGKVTHALSRSQLDHILVSHHFSIKKADALPDQHGSDHRPVRVEIA